MNKLRLSQLQNIIKMSRNLSPSEQLTHSTVRIESLLPGGNTATGTGFFFQFLRNGDQHVPGIVTNKHVIESATKGRFSMTLADEEGNPQHDQKHSFTIENFQESWIKHPDPNVDLCAMPIAPLLKLADQQDKRMFYISLDDNLIPSDKELSNFNSIEDIIMIGYPNGIWDAANNKPIVRKGITATHPRFDYNGKHEFMIDAACFPGSSGSPVFLYNPGSYTTKKGGTVIGTRIKFLGILYAGPQHTATGELEVVEVPTKNKPVAVSRIPNNLGNVIKAKKVLELEPEIQKLINN